MVACYKILSTALQYSHSQEASTHIFVGILIEFQDELFHTRLYSFRFLLCDI
jgi:hypothetical protein